MIPQLWRICLENADFNANLQRCQSFQYTRTAKYLYHNHLSLLFYNIKFTIIVMKSVGQLEHYLLLKDTSQT